MTRTQVRRRRVGVAVVVVALGTAFAGGRASAAGRPGGRAEQTYVVRPGDTLWSIARRTVGTAGDPRPFVQALIDRNRVADGEIAVGEHLIVPAG